LHLKALKVAAFSLYGPQAASHRVRLSQFQPGLAKARIDLRIQSLLDDAYLKRRFTGSRTSLRSLLSAYQQRLQDLSHLQRYDLAIVYAELFPFFPASLERLLLRIPYILDLDDAFFLKYRTGRLAFASPLLGAKFDRLLSGAVSVTAGSQPLLAYCQRFNPAVTLLPSVVDTDHYRPATSRPAAPFTIGWIGSPSTAPFLHGLVEPFRELARERSVRLLVVGGTAPSIPGVDVVAHPWTIEREVALIQQFSVGVMPLPDTPWARGKCAYKLIQCLACAVPVVASPVGANRDAVPPTVGILADTTSEWLKAFRQLADDAHLRHQLGTAGRRWVESHYSLQSALPVLTGVIRKARAES